MSSCHAVAALLAGALVIVAPRVATAGAEHSLMGTAALAVGSVEDAGYGATGVFGAGWKFDEVFGLALQGGVGITEEAGVGPERFFHLAALVPATMTICSSESWICPGSTFELVVISGVGVARFEGRWSPDVVAGVALDTFRKFTGVELGIRLAVQGSYDVINFDRLTAMLHMHLGVIIRTNLF